MAQGDLTVGLLMAVIVIGGLLWMRDKNNAKNNPSMFDHVIPGWTSREGFQRQDLGHLAYASPDVLLAHRDRLEARVGGPLFH
jgi:hypothetical protein